jgi:hypothetical protein
MQHADSLAAAPGDSAVYGGYLGNIPDDPVAAGSIGAASGSGTDGARTSAGSGGGGSGWGTIGTGRYGTIGHGSGPDSGYGVGGVGLSGASPARNVSLGKETTTPEDGLDKAIIRRYVKHNLLKIQSCYEQALASKPKLAGTLTARFTIGEHGSVTSTYASGVDPWVETCVAQVIGGIEFPKPKDNKKVDVVYPFTFRSPTDTAPEAHHGDVDRAAVAARLRDSAEWQKTSAELDAMKGKVKAANDAVANAKDTNDLKAARSRLAALYKEKDELWARMLAEKAAAEKAVREGGVQTRKQCTDNPQAKGC